ncbi:YcgN family cysteine cluster protein [Oceanospirillum sediminis]|uniref:UPF0260 protein H4O21_10620 n=1 Tax=Oceanospirillum sediminis TaxID=2760088 RepID=A0A839IP83_9GAMM|nr:YcgN family cysteine cluster protein [Oceanospirillum sediminis]MBB1487065.1 YcgN family cysteine cluster protein [Oceanospirillum sediminis]
MMLQDRFWEQKSLRQMNDQEWEALCDGCGKCCLHKLEDEDDGEIYYTDVACKLLDITTCQCNDYPNRLQQVPGCLQLTPDADDVFEWLPSSCAYRLLREGKPLPSWHHLMSGKADSIHKARRSIRRRSVSEQVVDPDEMEMHIIGWID